MSSFFKCLYETDLTLLMNWYLYLISVGMKSCFHATHKMIRIDANLYCKLFQYHHNLSKSINILSILIFCIIWTWLIRPMINNLMKDETIIQINFVTYLVLTISCPCLKLFQYKKFCMSSHLQESWKTEWTLPGTCGYKSIHTFMNSWKHDFMPLYCINYDAITK